MGESWGLEVARELSAVARCLPPGWCYGMEPSGQLVLLPPPSIAEHQRLAQLDVDERLPRP